MYELPSVNSYLFYMVLFMEITMHPITSVLDMIARLELLSWWAHVDDFWALLGHFPWEFHSHLMRWPSAKMMTWHVHYETGYEFYLDETQRTSFPMHWKLRETPLGVVCFISLVGNLAKLHWEHFIKKSMQHLNTIGLWNCAFVGLI
jgi:hypothetical protein